MRSSDSDKPAATEDDVRVVGADRVLAVLAELARHPDGIGLEELATIMRSSKATTHRALQSLKRVGFAEQDPQRRYVLGSEFLRLAFSNHEARPDHMRIREALHELAIRYQETTQYGVLDGGSIVYRSKDDGSNGALRLTSIVGGRDPAHSTAIGKLLLSYSLKTDEDVKEWADRYPLTARTRNTITTTEAFGRELDTIRAQGYAIDDQENEVGVNCLAVPAFLGPQNIPSGAVSISTSAARTPLDKLLPDAEKIRSIVASHEIGPLDLFIA